VLWKLSVKHFKHHYSDGIDLGSGADSKWIIKQVAHSQVSEFAGI
jgi:hypothetical protein